MTKRLLPYIVIVILAISSFLLTKELFSLRESHKDLKDAIKIEQTNNVQYKQINDSLQAAFVKTQVINRETAKTLFKDELEAFKQQTNRNTKDLKEFLKTQINGQNTYVFNNINSDSCKSLNLNYSDYFTDIEVTVKDGTAVIDTKSRTYLTKYTYKTRKKEAWYKPWKWGKELRTEIKSENPKDSIVNIKEIIIE